LLPVVYDSAKLSTLSIFLSATEDTYSLIIFTYILTTIYLLAVFLDCVHLSSYRFHLPFGLKCYFSLSNLVVMRSN